MEKKPTSGLTKGRVILLIALLLAGSGLGNVFAVLTPEIDNLKVQMPTFYGDNYYLGSSTNVTDILKYPETSYSFVIWKSGSTYYAKNGTTGIIDYSGADASTVIQAAIDSVEVNKGGIIFIRNGNYTAVDLTIDSSGVTLLGEGIQTDTYGAYEGAVLHSKDDASPIVTCTATIAHEVFDITLKNLIFDGYYNENGIGVSATNIFRLHIEGCVFNEFDLQAIYAYSIYDLNIEHNIIRSCGGAVALGDAADKTTIEVDGNAGAVNTANTFVRIIDNDLGGPMYRGVSVTGIWDNCVIEGNYIEGVTHYSGAVTIPTANSIYITTSNVQVIRNWCSSSGGSSIFNNNNAANIVIDRNTVTLAEGSGIQTGTTDYPFIITNNAVTWGESYGLQINSGNETLIQGNIIHDNDASGIIASKRSKIINNNLYNNGHGGGWGTNAGVFLNSAASSGSILTGNSIWDNQGGAATQTTGIVFSSSDYDVIEENYFGAGVTTVLDSAGTNCRIHNNYGYTTGDKVYTDILYIDNNIYYPENTNSFTLWKDGATYYSRNEHSGAISSGATFSTIFNAAETALSTGGLILLKHGNYTATASLSITHDDVTVMGEVIGSNQDASGTIIYKSFNGNLFSILGTTANRLENVKINNLLLHTDGASTGNGVYGLCTDTITLTSLKMSYINGCGVKLFSALTPTIINCFFTHIGNASSPTLQLTANGTTYNSKILIERNKFEHDVYRSIELGYTNDQCWITTNHLEGDGTNPTNAFVYIDKLTIIENNYMYNAGGIGIKTGDGANIKILNNSIQDTGGDSIDTSTLVSYPSEIRGNRVISSGGYGIYCGKYATVSNNEVTTSQNAAIVTGNTNYIFNNILYDNAQSNGWPNAAIFLTNANANYTQIIGNKFWDTTGKQTTGIQNRDYEQIVDNQFLTGTTTPIASPTLNEKIRNNIGYTASGEVRINGANFEAWNATSTSWVVIGP